MPHLASRTRASRPGYVRIDARTARDLRLVRRSVEKRPVAVQRPLGGGDQASLVRRSRVPLEQLARVGGMLVVELGMEAEVRGSVAALLEAVVLDEAGELGARDPRLAGFDRIQDRERFERIVRRRPG